MRTPTLQEIEDYCYQTLPQEAHTQIDTARAQDAAIDEEIRDYQAIFEGLQALAFEDLLQEVTHWEAETPSATPAAPSSPTKFFTMRTLGIAAALALVLLPLGYYLFMPPSNEALFETYYQPSVGLTVRGEEVRGASTFERAAQAFSNQEYAKTKQILVEETHSKTPAELRLLAAAEIELEAFAAAIPALLELLESEEPVFIEEAEWNLALVYLRINNTDASRKWLEKIVADDMHEYFDHAETLLETI